MQVACAHLAQTTYKNNENSANGKKVRPLPDFLSSDMTGPIQGRARDCLLEAYADAEGELPSAEAVDISDFLHIPVHKTPVITDASLEDIEELRTY